jgi:site-specific recombinase XerD
LQYINTGFLVSERGIRTVYDEKGKKCVEISDKRVLKSCLDKIETYAQRMNRINSKNMDCKTLIRILEESHDGLSFTEYAKEFIGSMINEGRDNPARNYKIAVNNLHKYMGKDNIMFHELTTIAVQGWIDSMRESARKKSLYPSVIRAIFNSAMEKYNDYDYDIIRIKFNPFVRVKIPKENVPEKRSVDPVNICRYFLSDVTYPAYEGISRMEMGYDVSLLIFCLAGINAADLYDLKKGSLNNWVLKYNRKKTRTKSANSAYMEITVPVLIRPLFEKYKGDKNMLFSFSKRFSTSTAFVKTVSKGIKAVCEQLNTSKMTTYTFRHSWATIAQNNCGASTELVAFSLNHSSAHRVTEGYIRKSYAPVDVLNEKVVDFVFAQTILMYVPFYALIIFFKKK